MIFLFFFIAFWLWFYVFMLARSIALVRRFMAPSQIGETNAPAPVHVSVIQGAAFDERTFRCDAGSRDFKLYVPASAPLNPRGLVVMLHGCKQNPDDFAVGTGMNAYAEIHGLLIAYPRQVDSHNRYCCWNWFEPAHQKRGTGEPAIIAQMALGLIDEFRIDRSSVFVAGLSAGGAMAVIMGVTYPDVFKAVGVHSGLAFQSASNPLAAIAVMRGYPVFGKLWRARRKSGAPSVRTIIFQGIADRVVRPSNAQPIADSLDQGCQTNHETGSANGRTFSLARTVSTHGRPVIELWTVEGLGHAWSGGNAAGSFTDSKGPVASLEMVRFFVDDLKIKAAGPNAALRS
jgi:poly(hydroxyalkanoate) depolymerase family esterase